MPRTPFFCIPFYLCYDITMSFWGRGCERFDVVFDRRRGGKLKLCRGRGIRELGQGIPLHCRLGFFSSRCEKRLQQQQLKGEMAYFHLQLRYSLSWSSSRSTKPPITLARSKEQGIHAPVLLTLSTPLSPGGGYTYNQDGSAHTSLCH